jgi:ribose-phosphate pyrophosphokinase
MLTKNRKSQLLELIVTDSILEERIKKIRVLSCAPLFAEVMHMCTITIPLAGSL